MASLACTNWAPSHQRNPYSILQTFARMIFLQCKCDHVTFLSPYMTPLLKPLAGVPLPTMHFKVPSPRSLSSPLRPHLSPLLGTRHSPRSYQMPCLPLIAQYSLKLSRFCPHNPVPCRSRPCRWAGPIGENCHAPWKHRVLWEAFPGSAVPGDPSPGSHSCLTLTFPASSS